MLWKRDQEQPPQSIPEMLREETPQSRLRSPQGVRPRQKYRHGNTGCRAFLPAKSHGVVYKRTRWTKPTVLRLDQVGAGDTYVLFFNGVSGWEILPDKGLVELTGDELAFAEGYAKGVDINLWLADEDINNLLASS